MREDKSYSYVMKLLTSPDIGLSNFADDFKISCTNAVKENSSINLNPDSGH